jgi:hypothetical protein
MRTPADLRPVLTTVLAHITAADQKAAALLTIAGVLVAFPAPSILVPRTPDSVPAFSTVCAAISACAFIVSIYGALMVLFPRTKNKTDTASLIFFGDIGATTHAEYAAALDRADDARVRDDLIAQIHINSKIACMKHSRFKLAVASLVTGIVFLAACYVGIAVSAKPLPVQKSGAPAQRTDSK